MKNAEKVSRQRSVTSPEKKALIVRRFLADRSKMYKGPEVAICGDY